MVIFFMIIIIIALQINFQKLKAPLNSKYYYLFIEVKLTFVIIFF